MKHDIGLQIKMVSDKIQTRVDASVKPFGITFSQGTALRFIISKGGQVTQKEIETFLNVSHPATVGVITRLEEKGFVTCFQDQNNRRNKIVKVTQKAIELDDAIHYDQLQHESMMTKGFSDSEIQQLSSLLSRIYNNLD